MAEKKKNLSEYDINAIPDATDMSFAIIVSEWNSEITFALRDGALETLEKHGVLPENIMVKYVPGSFELPMGAKFAAEKLGADAVICIGCVIQGETRHFEFINNAVADGITKVGLMTDVPIIYGVLTPDNMEQAKERAGGKHGNKGDEAAITAIKMIALQWDVNHWLDDDGWDYDHDEDDLPFDDDDDYDDDENNNTHSLN